MKTFTIATALTLLASQAFSAPTPADTLAARQFEAQITFEGAPPDVAQFTMFVPTDKSVFPIYNPLSISHIRSAGGAVCSFHGIDGSDTVVVGAQTVDVGPPQTQVSGSCRAL